RCFPRLCGRDLATSDADPNRFCERRLTNDVVIDGNLPTGAGSRDVELSDTPLQGFDGALHFRSMGRATFGEKSLERRERRGVILKLKMRLTEVVEDRSVRSDLVSPLELDERRTVVRLVVKGDGTLKMRVGLFLRIARFCARNK